MTSVIGIHGVMTDFSFHSFTKCFKGGLSLEKFGFSDAGQFCDSVCFEYMNILALKYFLFEIKRTFGSEVMVNLLKGVS